MSTIDTIQNRWGGAAVVVGPSVSAYAYKLFVAIESLATRMSLAFERQTTRRELARLSDQQLDDIGITRADALREAGRPIWY
ncbi:MAG: DUF1127 domain-containing protein [Salaquimonas sp.]|jgi:uncharacterized protein YjiS (DUF1127 family)|nr:DUF1127 domain-containing protein [Salaquimonas sp.]